MSNGTYTARFFGGPLHGQWRTAGSKRLVADGLPKAGYVPTNEVPVEVEYHTHEYSYLVDVEGRPWWVRRSEQ